MKIESLIKLREWATQNGMSFDSRTYKGYHFTTLYPMAVEAFWEIMDELDSQIKEPIKLNLGTD